MRAVTVVAGGVFKDSIRDRIAYNLVFFAVLLMAASFLLAQLTAAGATLVSLNPIRETLEDFFVQQVTSAEVMTMDRA